jgi:hypothetical protein
MIFFNHQAIHASTLRTSFANRGYENLFPDGGKILFGGCNVAEDDAGWGFLEAAASLFFPRQVGLTLGWTSTGYFVPQWSLALSPLLWLTSGGHMVHVQGETRQVLITYGIIVQRYEDPHLMAGG